MATASARLPTAWCLGRFVIDLPDMRLAGRSDFMGGVEIAFVGTVVSDPAIAWREHIQRFQNAPGPMGHPSAFIDSREGDGALALVTHFADRDDPDQVVVEAAVPTGGGLTVFSASANGLAFIETAFERVQRAARSFRLSTEIEFAPPDGFCVPGGAIMLQADGPEQTTAVLRGEGGLQVEISLATVALPRVEPIESVTARAMETLAAGGVHPEIMRAGAREAAGLSGSEIVLRIPGEAPPKFLAMFSFPGEPDHAPTAPSVSITVEGPDTNGLEPYDQIIGSFRRL